MLTKTQQDQLLQLGYHVVYSDRGMTNPLRNTYAVCYPNRRPEAYSSRYSNATFPSRDLAWADAWRDFEEGNHLVSHAYTADPGFVLQD